jgi:hypothetical protein
MKIVTTALNEPCRLWAAWQRGLKETAFLRVIAQQRQARGRMISLHVVSTNTLLISSYFAEWKAFHVSLVALAVKHRITCRVITRRRQLACLR